MLKKSLLLTLLLALLVPWAANAQEQTVITCYPPTQEYATGYTDGTTKTSGEMQCISYGGVRGWMKFDVSSIPAGATIDAIKIYFYCTSTSNSYVKLTSAGELDPATASASELNEAIGTTTPNYYTSSYMSGFSSIGWKNFSMSAGAKTNLQTNGLTNGYFTVGFYEYETYSGYYMYASGYEDANKPYLQVTCTVPVTCSKPTLSNEVTTTATTATLSWTPSSTEQTLFDIYWSEDNTAPTELTTPSAANQTGTSYTIPGLTPGKTYYAWIRGNCGTASSPDYTFWTNGVSFDTQCQAIAALGYDEKFDTYTASSGFLPNCWTPINGGSSYNTYPCIYGYNAYSTSNCLRFYTSGSATTTTITDQYAVLPEMTGLAGLQITFMARGNNSGNTFKIGQMTDPTDVSTFNEIGTKSLTTSYEECNFTLTDKGNYIAILMEKPTSSSSTTIGIYIDNINIHTPPTCIKPTDLAVTASGLNATVTWESDESQWQVARATSATADPLENIIATVNAKTFTDKNLPLADYYYWVRSYCSASDQSDWVGPVSVHIGYCVPAPSSTDGNGISNVTFGIDPNIVNNDTPKAGYADYSNQIGALQAGVEAEVNITYGHTYTYGTFIWVDWNNDLDFEDTGEVIYYGMSAGSSTAPHTLTANFTIPATKTPGDYRMRIGGADDAFNSEDSGDPCYTGSWAAFQDYTLRVLEAPSCLIPTGLALNASGHTLQASWDGTATSYNIDINGTVTNNVTSPYVFDVELSTTYTVKVQANCAGSETSDWSSSASYTTPDCWGGHFIEYTLTDQYDDSWNGASISVVEGCGDIVATLTCASDASPFAGTLTLCSDYYRFIWNSGNYDSECGFTFTEGGTTLFTKPSSLSDGQVLYTIGTTTPIPTGLTAGTPDIDNVELSWTENGTATAWQICINGDEEHPVNAGTNPFTLTGLTPDTDYSVMVRAYIDATNQSCWSAEETFTTDEACAKPTDLTETAITTNSATLSWTGTNDSYVLQYRPWHQVGEDKQATANYTKYTYDLSAFSGMGSIAIRHYDVSDMFYLNIDNVQLTNASNDVILSQDFESGIPANWTNYDVDGDGYTWDLASSSNMTVIGNYGVYSASWLSGVGALHPDNWLIINNVEFGGTFSFYAVGQDPSYPAENFAVYVSLDSDLTEVDNLTSTSYTANNLEPGTPYAWQVKGICSKYESNWVSALFKTKDDVLVFATDGDWDDLANWEDVDGNAIIALPTINNKVRVDANAIVPAGFTATAGKTTIDGGSITIKDGGQLKHNSATLKVTLEKDIIGYGAGNEDVKDHYYLISAPFTGTTQLSYNAGWSHVLNMTSGNYDLYGFSASDAGAEWINNEVAPTHAVFTAGNNNGLVFQRGYLYANESDVTLEFTGTISKTVNQNYSWDFTYDNTSTADFNGFELVGNTFPCNGYLSFTPTSGTSQNIDFYVMNTDGDGFELGQTTVALAPLQGAFFYADLDGTINFSTEAPSTSTGGNSGILNISLTQSQNRGGVVDQARIRFGQGLNLTKMSFKDANAKVYIPQGNKDYAVVRAEAQGEMPVCFKAAENGTYTLSFNSENTEFSYLHLIDNLTGNDVDLLANPSYTFDARYTDYASRFKLVFATGNNSNEDNFGFIDANGNLNVLGINGAATLQVIDVTGRILSSETFSGSYSKAVNAAQGIYMIRLIQGENVRTQKIVVK